ncbi:TPA: hypothetical protein JG870_003425 [Enterobacter hormaechei subsp. steigerwaltii]|nr:hypothetical protein [Enterobacter hormaechei subsp. steigerwaltii]
MEKNSWVYMIFLLPLTHFFMWLRGAFLFLSNEPICLISFAFLFMVIVWLTFCFGRVRVFLVNSDAGAVFLNDLMGSKIKVSTLSFLFVWCIAEISPGVAFPILYLLAVMTSVIVFSVFRYRDVLAIQDIVFKDDAGNKNETLLFHFLSGGGWNSRGSGCHVCDVDILNTFNDVEYINPASGLPMFGGIGSVDVNGDVYGTSSSHYHDV